MNQTNSLMNALSNSESGPAPQNMSQGQGMPQSQSQGQSLMSGMSMPQGSVASMIANLGMNGLQGGNLDQFMSSPFSSGMSGMPMGGMDTGSVDYMNMQNQMGQPGQPGQPRMVDTILQAQEAKRLADAKYALMNPTNPVDNLTEEQKSRYYQGGLSTNEARSAGLY